MTSRALRAKLILLATSSMTVMAGATVAPALPKMRAVFADVGHVDLLVRLVLTLPALFTALHAPVAGYLIDRLGRRLLLMLGLVLYAASGSSGLYVESLAALLVGRALLGASVAFIMTASTTLISDYFDGVERERFLGIQAASMGLGAVVFLTLGGALADVHWRMPFTIYAAALPLLVVVAARLSAPDTASGGTTGVGVDSQRGVSALAIAVIYVCALLGMALFYLIPVQLPFYLQEIASVSAARTGFAIACATFVSAFTSLQYQNMRRHLSNGAIFAILFAVVSVGYRALASADGYASVLVAMVICGLGFGLLVPNANVWLARLAPVRTRGRLIGGLTTCFFLGQFISPLVAQPLMQRHGLGGTWGVFGVAGLVSALISVAFVVASVARASRARRLAARVNS